MADDLKFDLVSPERQLVSEEVHMVQVPGTEGDFGVLAGHAPVMSTLRPGVIEIDRDEGEATRIFVNGGFAEVTPEGLTILAEEAVPVADLDAEQLDQQIKNAEEDVEDAQEPEKKRRAQENLDHLRMLREALSL